MKVVIWVQERTRSKIEDFPQGWGNLIRQSPLGQRKIPLISTSYNWDSLDGGAVFMILGDEILPIRVRLREGNIISLLNKNHYNERTPEDRFTEVRRD